MRGRICESICSLCPLEYRANHLDDKGHDNAKALPRPNQLIITTKQTEVSHSLRRIA
jgi:hypothetical protein